MGAINATKKIKGFHVIKQLPPAEYVPPAEILLKSVKDLFLEDTPQLFRVRFEEKSSLIKL